MLFNVADDPDERNNLANDSEENTRLEAFRSDCSHKWNEAALISAIQQSQKRRILVRAAMSKGVKQRWNHNAHARIKSSGTAANKAIMNGHSNIFKLIT